MPPLPPVVPFLRNTSSFYTRPYICMCVVHKDTAISLSLSSHVVIWVGLTIPDALYVRCQSVSTSPRFLSQAINSSYHTEKQSINPLQRRAAISNRRGKTIRSRHLLLCLQVSNQECNSLILLRYHRDFVYHQHRCRGHHHY